MNTKILMKTDSEGWTTFFIESEQLPTREINSKTIKSVIPLDSILDRRLTNSIVGMEHVMRFSDEEIVKILKEEKRLTIEKKPYHESSEYLVKQEEKDRRARAHENIIRCW